MPNFYEIGRTMHRERADSYLYFDDSYLDVDWSQLRRGADDEDRCQHEASDLPDEEFEYVD